MADSMKISVENVERICSEKDIYNELLELDDKHILELGCGNAALTRDIAITGSNRSIIALEVDKIAHEKNLQIADLPNVRFCLAGAEDIPLEDESVDVVFMFKSLHHVPLELMHQSMREIRRVLRPGGYVYISEPIFDGEFNEILRLFHDEQKVREAAFDTIKQVVNDGMLKLISQTFFKSPFPFENFEDFEKRVLKATYNKHNLDDSIYQTVKQMFQQHAGKDGAAEFKPPMRVDLLQK